MSEEPLLLPKQMEVLAALVAGSSVTAAAAAAGLHRTTIHNWSRVDPIFRAVLQDARNSRAEAATEKLAEMFDSALSTLQSILNDPAASTAQRLKAALAVINSATKRPARQPKGGLDVDEYNELSHELYPCDDSDDEEQIDETENTPEPPISGNPAKPPIAAQPSPQFHHFSSPFIRKEEIPASAPVAGQTPRNAPCPCGSRLKFKRCCGRAAPPVLSKAKAAAA